MPIIYHTKGMKNLLENGRFQGMSGLEHRVGGLEKENLTGNVSYDSNNRYG